MKFKMITFLLMSYLFSVSFSSARESTGKWDDESIAKYSMKFYEYIKDEQIKRNRTLQAYTPELVVKLEHSFFNSPADSEKGEMRSKYAEAKLNKKKTKIYLDGMFKELKRNQDLLVASEAKAMKLWKPRADLDQMPTEQREAELLGRKVKAANIGVILDSSPSMAPYIKALREDVKTGFRYHTVREVNGCQLPHYDPRWEVHQGWFFADAPAHMNPFDPKWHSPASLSVLDSESVYWRWLSYEDNSLAAIQAFVMLEVDTIYWLSDFEDKRHETSEKYLTELLRKNRIHLYMHSVESSPRKGELVKFAKKTGSVKRVRLRKSRRQ